jgi:long-chain acyl-CoA synthetase
MKPGVPADLPCISYPLSPPNDYPRLGRHHQAHPPLQGEPVRDGAELSTIIYTSGTTGMPKGVMHSFGTFAWSLRAGLKRVPIDNSDGRMLSYLPLAHVAERVLVEHALAGTGMSVFFAEIAGHLHRRPAARTADGVLLGAAAVGQVPAGRARQDAAREAQRLLKIPIVRGIVRKKILEGARPGPVHASPPAAPRRCRPSCWRLVRQARPADHRGYGMTENCGVSHATVPGVQRPGTVGPPYEGVQSRIDPANGEIQMKSRA